MTDHVIPRNLSSDRAADVGERWPRLTTCRRGARDELRTGGGKMDRWVEVLSQGRERISGQRCGRGRRYHSAAFFPRVWSGRTARMSGAAALQIAEPLPPVHAVELGFVPEGLQHSLVAASLLPHVDGGLEAAGPLPRLQPSCPHTLVADFRKDDQFPSDLVEPREIIGHGAG